MIAVPSISGKRFFNLNPARMEIVVCNYAAFAVNKDDSSQLRILSMLRDMSTARLISYSTRRKRASTFARECSPASFLHSLTVIIPEQQ